MYVPAIMMLFFGKNFMLLPTFFYIGTVLALLIGVLLAYQLYRTRFMFYVMVPVFIARTFPRVSYYYWGGLRYFIGLASLFLAIQCFKKNRLSFMFMAGICSALSFLTTIEAGVSAIAAILAGTAAAYCLKIFEKDFIGRSIKFYVGGLLPILIPYFFYLWVNGAFWAYWDFSIFIPLNMNTTLSDPRGTVPENAGEFLLALLPGSPFFKFMTPVYFYLILFGYLIYRVKKNKLNWEIYPLVTIAVYGLILYAAAFRKIEGHHFEMALQPEKILFFFILEEIYLILLNVRRSYLKTSKNLSFPNVLVGNPQQIHLGPDEAITGPPTKTFGGDNLRISSRKIVAGINLLILIFAVSSITYSFSRYNKRFPAIQWVMNKITGKEKDLSLLKDIPKRPLNIERGKGMVVPVWQADEIEGVTKFLKENTAPDEAVFTFAELGNFNFWADRPFVGRFPIATFSWYQDRWHEELVADFKKAQPRFVVMTNLGHRTFPAALYFRYEKNVRKFNEFTRLILDHYTVVKSFESVSIYKRKENF